jgi:hypothetical protein
MICLVAELYIVRRKVVTEIQSLYFYKCGNYMWWGDAGHFNVTFPHTVTSTSGIV